jgi:hypothetical protein
LPHVFREIEERLAVADGMAERKRAAARREAEERQGQWRALMDDARKRLMADERRTLLFAQERAWRDARSLREYCDAMEVAHGEHPDTAEWLAWARDFADGLDPLSEQLSMPGCPRRHQRGCRNIYRTAGAFMVPNTGTLATAASTSCSS